MVRMFCYVVTRLLKLISFLLPVHHIRFLSSKVYPISEEFGLLAISAISFALCAMAGQ